MVLCTHTEDISAHPKWQELVWTPGCARRHIGLVTLHLQAQVTGAFGTACHRKRSALFTSESSATAPWLTLEKLDKYFQKMNLWTSLRFCHLSHQETEFGFTKVKCDFKGHSRLNKAILTTPLTQCTPPRVSAKICAVLLQWVFTWRDILAPLSYCKFF